MAVIMDNYAKCVSLPICSCRLSYAHVFFLAHSQLAEQYGSEVASDILARSRASAHLDFSPPTSGIVGMGATYMSSHGRYDSLAAKAPEENL
jgi:hypothetical protein